MLSIDRPGCSMVTLDGALTMRRAAKPVGYEWRDFNAVLNVPETDAVAV